MSVDRTIILSKELQVNLADAVAKLELMMTELAAAGSASSKDTNFEKLELKAGKFALQAAWAEFKTKQLEWEITHSKSGER